jgi:hypothetical protein
MSTWYVAHSPKQLWRTYTRMRKPVIWRLNQKNGAIRMRRSSRGPVAALVALWRYWRAPLPF